MAIYPPGRSDPGRTVVVSPGDRDLVVTVGGRRSRSSPAHRHPAARARRGPPPETRVARGRYLPPWLESPPGRVAYSSPLTAGTGLPRTLACTTGSERW